MSGEEKYLLDADSFIRSKRQHYAFDFCPGFWDALLKGYEQGRVTSIEPIRKELLKGKDKLADWLKNVVPEDFFEPVDEGDVEDAFSRVVQWVEANDRYVRAAKAEIRWRR
jgi:hypothetical protein